MKTFVNQNEGSNKFWTIEQIEKMYAVSWGKIGANGRVITKDFESDEACSQEVEKLIKEKIAKGYLQIEDLSAVPVKSTDQATKPLDEDDFWDIIGLLNWDKTGDDAAVIRPAVKRLASLNKQGIYKFADLLAEKLFMLDGISFASNIGEDSYSEEGNHFSVDYFLYVRCAVVANGREYFHSVLADPRQMPEEVEFEALLTLPEEAFSKKNKNGRLRS